MIEDMRANMLAAAGMLGEGQTAARAGQETAATLPGLFAGALQQREAGGMQATAAVAALEAARAALAGVLEAIIDGSGLAARAKGASEETRDAFAAAAEYAGQAELTCSATLSESPSYGAVPESMAAGMQAQALHMIGHGENLEAGFQRCKPTAENIAARLGALLADTESLVWQIGLIGNANGELDSGQPPVDPNLETTTAAVNAAFQTAISRVHERILNW